MERKTDQQSVTVWLVNGPWDGLEIAGVYDPGEIFEVDPADLGAFMPEPGHPDSVRRAVYEPGEDRTLWCFVGWQ